MAIESADPRTREAQRTVFVDTFTNGLLGPDVAMLGPVADGGHVVWNSTPGCWGPMITPSIRGGHEVAQPVAVAGAEVGDAIAVRIKDIEVTSLATASGTDQPMEGRFKGDPFCAPVCPGCGAEWTETRIEGIGPESVRCVNCGADATPFTFSNGYTIAFDELRTVGLTVPQEAAERFAHEAPRFAALPDNSAQNPILTFAPHDIVALATRLLCRNSVNDAERRIRRVRHIARDDRVVQVRRVYPDKPGTRWGRLARAPERGASAVSTGQPPPECTG